jgi:hypothetical protein
VRQSDSRTTQSDESNNRLPASHGQAVVFIKLVARAICRVERHPKLGVLFDLADVLHNRPVKDRTAGPDEDWKRRERDVESHIAATFVPSSGPVIEPHTFGQIQRSLPRGFFEYQCDSERPGFAWFFGRYGLWTTLAI